MALTLPKLQRLDDADLVTLLQDESATWVQMGRRAYRYAAEIVEGSGEPVRPDDASMVLVPALQVCDQLQDHLARHRLSQKYWVEWFAELIFDRLWDEIHMEG